MCKNFRLLSKLQKRPIAYKYRPRINLIYKYKKTFVKSYVLIYKYKYSPRIYYTKT
jgi:hypothetical protein